MCVTVRAQNYEGRATARDTQKNIFIFINEDGANAPSLRNYLNMLLCYVLRVVRYTRN